MSQYYCDPNDFEGMSDSERIQKAVDNAVKTGRNKVVIPGYNTKRNSNKWIIDNTILLPSDITVVLDNCHLRMADDVICQMFCNKNAYTDIGNTQEGEQKNIFIKGMGNAVLDGGKENVLNEFTSQKSGNPCITQNLTIYLHNVSNFEIDNLKIKNQRWWAMEFMFARDGRIANLKFELEKQYINSYGTWRNQDGIDLRIGCSNIIIENISGETGDDTIALTALTMDNGHESKQLVDGRDTDIHDVIIQNVRAFSHMCAIVRLLNQQGNKVYNIVMDNIIDISRPKMDSKVQMAIRIGENGYYDGIDAKKVKHGETFNISISNLFTRAITAIHAEATVKNLHVSNVYVNFDGHHVFTCGGFELHDHIFMYVPERWEEQKRKILHDKGPNSGIIAENVTIENIYYTANSGIDNYDPALCVFNAADARNIKIKNIYCDRKVNVLKLINTKDNADIVCENIRG